jgi:MFS family permease
MIALGVAAGVALPPISTSMRAVWGALTGEDERTAAYSLVYLVQELSILLGPLILSAVTAAASAAAGLIVVSVLSCAGTLAFAASVSRSRSGADGTRGGATHVGAARAGRGVLRVPAARVVLLIALLVGGVIGGLEVAVPLFATAHHSPASAGLLIAAVSVGGIIGAALYGSAHWRIAPARRLVVLLALMSVWLGLLIGVDGLLVAGVLLLLIGGPLNPALTTFSLLIDAYVPKGAAAEAFGWLSTAIAGGGGIASALAAALAHHRDARVAFAVAAVAGVSATVIAAVGIRTSR